MRCALEKLSAQQSAEKRGQTTISSDSFEYLVDGEHRGHYEAHHKNTERLLKEMIGQVAEQVETNGETNRCT